MRFFTLNKLGRNKLPNKLRKIGRCGRIVERGWPGYLFGGRIRTSTVVLIVAFAALWWIYDDYQHSVRSSRTSTQVPATQVVPPGFVPDPNYTWVPRSRLQQPPVTVTVTRTTPPPLPTPTTTSPEPAPPTATTEPPPPFELPPLLPPPFGPPAPMTTSPLPGQAPEPPAVPPPPG